MRCQGLYNRARRTGKEDSTTWAREPFWLLEVANPLNIIQGQVENGDLNEAGEGGSDDLRHKHGSWRYLHIMSKLQISDEVQCLGPRISLEMLQSWSGIILHSDVSKCFETSQTLA